MLNNMRSLRIGKGISQSYLGKIAGVSQQAINSYENSETQPDFVVLFRIADYFQVTIDYLLNRNVTSILPSELSKYSFDEESIQYIKKYLSLSSEKKKALDPVIEMLQTEKKD